MTWKLSRVLSAAGVASRRGAEELIRAGRVRVNGRVVRDVAARCRPDRDRVDVDGRTVRWPPERVVVALNKPAGYATTRRDPHAARTVYDLLRGAPAGLHPVGRLDVDSRGLLLLTNDGRLTQLLTHPRHHVPRVYHVRVRGVPSARVLEDLRRGIPLADGPTRPVEVRVLEQDRGQDGEWTRLEITLREGRHRQIRRMMATVGHPVLDLQRVAVGPVRLDGLAEGRWRRLRPAEIRALEEAARTATEERSTGPRAEGPAGATAGGRHDGASDSEG